VLVALVVALAVGVMLSDVVAQWFATKNISLNLRRKNMSTTPRVETIEIV